MNTKNSMIGYALEIDIKKCFDKISYAWLINFVPMNSKILDEWLKCGYMERDSDTFLPTEEGTPQSSFISPILCNITLNGLEDCVKRIMTKLIGKKLDLTSVGIPVPHTLKEEETLGCVLVRYADDMVFLCRTINSAYAAKFIIDKFLTRRSVVIKEEKTRITDLLSPNYNKLPMIFLGAAFNRLKNN